MNHYPHHIGDFDRATRHLTRIERSVYRDLIELYYDTEEQLTLDKQALCRKIIARSNEEATAVEQVLNEFFNETPTGWYHARCEAELDKYRANNSQKAQAGKASAAAKALKRQQALNARCNEKSTDVETPLNVTSTNQEPITKNHKPLSDTRRGRATRFPDDFWTNEVGKVALLIREDWSNTDVLEEFECFKDYWIAQPGLKGVKTDWMATWRNWCRRSNRKGLIT